MNGAESLLRTAAASGIRVCFANPGTTELPLVDAFDSDTGAGSFDCTFFADGPASATASTRTMP